MFSYSWFFGPSQLFASSPSKLKGLNSQWSFGCQASLFKNVDDLRSLWAGENSACVHLAAHAARGLHVQGGGGDAALLRGEAADLQPGPEPVWAGEEGCPGGAQGSAQAGGPGAPTQPPEPECKLQQRPGKTWAAAQGGGNTSHYFQNIAALLEPTLLLGKDSGRLLDQIWFVVGSSTMHYNGTSVAHRRIYCSKNKTACGEYTFFIPVGNMYVWGDREGLAAPPPPLGDNWKQS